MKISLKNRQWAYLLNPPLIIVTCIIIFAIFSVMIGVRQKEVIILDTGSQMKEVLTYRNTVRDVLDKMKIQLNDKDKISPDLDAAVKDGMEILITRAMPVKVSVGGIELQFESAEQTVQEMLTAEGITVEKLDKVYPETETTICKNMEVKIVKVTEEEITEHEKIPFTNEIKEMPEIESGVENLLREGSEGEKLKTIKIIYEDGIEKERKVIDEKILVPPLSHLIAVGTLSWRSVSRGDSIKFSKMITMKATSYTDDIENTGKEGGNTATGTKPIRSAGGGRWSTVAVDPNVIPLGTKLWVEGYGYAIAEDVGGAVKGNIIDLFFENGSEEYLNWTTRKTRVYILK